MEISSFFQQTGLGPVRKCYTLIHELIHSLINLWPAFSRFVSPTATCLCTTASNTTDVKTCMRHRCFLTPACVCVGGLEVGFFSACSWLALVTGVGGYVLAGVEIGVCLVYFSIFAGVRVVGVCVLVYARTHT